MKRRDFVQGSLITLGSALLPVGTGGVNSGSVAGEKSPETDKLKIQYVREEVPAFEIPPYRGQRYEDRVPDTLDIAERARLGINALTSVTDPAADYIIYWTASFYRNPPVMAHHGYVVQIVEGFLEALPLLRSATGDDLNSHVDPVWMKVFLKCLGPDGLVYIPLNGGPLVRPEKSSGGLIWRSDGSTTQLGDESVAQFTDGQICSRPLGMMTLYYLRDKNPMWKEAAERMIQRLSALVVDKGNWCYLPAGRFEPNARVGPQAEMLTGYQAQEGNNRLIQGLSQYYKVTGYEPARELAAKLTRYILDHAQTYDAQGRFLWGEYEKNLVMHHTPESLKGLTVGGHSHLHTIGLLSMLEYATAVNDRGAMDFVRVSFEWAKSQSATFGVSPLIGWFTEWYLADYPSCECCTVADMIALAVNLSVAGAGDYWDDVDRWVRNDFAEQQLTSVDWIYRMASTLPPKPVARNETAERAPERNVGAFAGWSTGNEWGRSIMHCCTGNSTRTLYYVWEHMLEDKDKDELRVNLLLNRASRWVDIYSYIPYEGRVDLKIKQDCRSLWLRAPEWLGAQSPEIMCTVNGTARPLRWEGRYVDVGPAKPGDSVVVIFPNYPFKGFSQSERTVKERIGLVTYTLTLRGNTVVSIDPPGQNGALYERAAYRGGKVPWRKVQRFVPEQLIRW